MMFQMETHYFLSLFQCSCSFGLAHGEQLKPVLVLLLEQPEDPIPWAGKCLCPGCGPWDTLGSQDCFSSSTICLTKGDVWWIVREGMCWTYTLKVSISPVRLILSIRLASTFSLSFSSNCWETKQATGRSGFKLKIIVLENLRPGKVSFFKLNLGPNYIQKLTQWHWKSFLLGIPDPADLPGWAMVAPRPQRIKAPRSNM